MSPHVVINLTKTDGHSPTASPHQGNDNDNENHSPKEATPTREGNTNAGRVLYCRKCEGHGEKIILKNHAPQCPYILCDCKSCERLNQKRLKSFNKRNKEKLELAAALTEKRRQEEMEKQEATSSRKYSTCSINSNASESSNSMDSEPSSSRTGLEGRSMSLGAMTVMSYDIWKAKCAAEKKRIEDERAQNGGHGGPDNGPDSIDTAGSPKSPMKPPSPLTHIRKRAHTFAIKEEPREIPKVAPKNAAEKKGRYITLPTIPAMKIFVDENTPLSEKLASLSTACTTQHPLVDLTGDSTNSPPAPIRPTVRSPLTHPTMYSVPTLMSTVASMGTNSSPTTFTAPMTLPPNLVPVTGASQLQPALNMVPSLPRPHPITFAAPTPMQVAPVTTTPLTTPLMTPEQMMNMSPQALMIQQTILNQQSAALQQLLGLAGLAPPVSTAAAAPSIDILSFLRSQQLANVMAAMNPPKPVMPAVSEELLQSILAQQARQQPIYSHSL